MSDLLPFETALARVLAAFEPLETTHIPVGSALDYVLSAGVRAQADQPPHDVSAMDGYAVKACDVTPGACALKTPLSLIGESAAGHPFGGKIRSGECVRIFTGAFVPDGADAILIQENANLSPGPRTGRHRHSDTAQITPTQSVTKGEYVRPKGLDFPAGKVIPAGTVLDTRSLALVAAMNIGSVPVHRKPRIAVLSGGDEIKTPGSTLSAGQIASSNHIAIAALVTRAGGEPHFLGIVPDQLAAIGSAIEKARDFDLLITSGGASVGDHDLMQQAFENQGAVFGFKKVAMKPGKPVIFGRLGPGPNATPLLGLPGNPVSSYITALLFAVPAIQRMCGNTRAAANCVRARLDAPLAGNGPRREFRRVKLRTDSAGALWCTGFTNQDSSMLSRLALADGLLNVPPHAPELAAGEPVTVSLFP